MKILIVDDNPAVRRMIKGVVANIADEIHECADGAPALAVYAVQHPDFVLMDIVMAGMDGVTATRQIRAADPSARIIIVSSYDEVDLREAARSAGACGYVLKDNLLALRQLLSNPPGPFRDK